MFKKIFYWLMGYRKNRVLRDTAEENLYALPQLNEEHYKKQLEGNIMEKTIARVLSTDIDNYLELDFFNWYDNLEISKRSKLAKALKLKPGDRLEVSFKKISEARK